MAAHRGVETCFISAACNRSPFSLSWGRNGLILYGSGNLVAVYQPKNGEEPGSVLQTLSQHTAKVTCVRWIPKRNGEPSDEFVVGSADKTASLWRRQDSKFEVVSVLRGHSAAVTIAEAMYLPTYNKDMFSTLLVTSSVDSTVRIWERRQETDEVTCVQTVSCGNSFALDLALSTLPTTSVPVLACGWDDDRVHLWVRQGEDFREVATLKGHEDWVRGVEFTTSDDGELLLASCGQDHFIRVWKISLQCGEEQVTEDEIRVKKKSFTIQHGDKSQSYAVVLEAVLAGHENWVYGVHWQPAVFNDGTRHQPLSLLSASMDKTMILWKPDPSSGIWLDQDRVGEVGGNTLGFLGCQFSPDGQSIMAHGFQGALHLWHHVEHTQQTSWEPGVTVGGHFDGVEDIAWDPAGGEFLLSVSLDRTTRLFAPWRREGLKPCWYELGRPQIHGYAINCLAMVNRYQFVSGGDEKVLRVFDAPKNFLQNLKNVAGVDISKDMVEREVSNVPEGASVPALGLSNKALYEGELSVAEDADREIPSSFGEQYPQMYYQPLELHRPPTEEHLLQNTLWPETQKLYGHGYELFCVACNRQGTLVASACKASKAEHAAILLWDTSSWRQVGHLENHSLTVTQLRFSHAGHLLLSVSRDRTWALFRRQDADQPDVQYQEQCVMVVQYQEQCVMVVQYQGQCVMVVQHQGQCVMVVQHQGQCVMVVQYQEQCVMVVQYQEQCVMFSTRDSVMVVQYQGQCVMVVQYQGQCVMVVQYQGECVMVVQYQGQCVMVVQYQGQCVMVVQYQGQCVMVVQHQGQCVVVVQHQGQCVMVVQHQGQCVMVVQHQGQCVMVVQYQGQCVMVVQYQGQCVVVVQHQGQCVMVVQYQGQCVMVVQYQGQCVMVVQYQGQCVMIVQHQGQCVMVVQYQEQCVMVVQYQGQCVMVVQYQGQCVMVVQYQGQCVMVVQYQGQCVMVVQYQGQCVMVVQYQGQCVMVVQYQGQCVMVVQYQGQCVMVVQYQGQFVMVVQYQGQCVMVVQYQGQCVMVVQYQGQCVMVVQHQGQCVMVFQYQGQCVMVVQHQGQCVMVFQYQGQCVMVVQYQGQCVMVVQYQGQCVMVVQYQGQCVMVVQYQGQCVMVVQYQGQCVMVVQYQGQCVMVVQYQGQCVMVVQYQGQCVMVFQYQGQYMMVVQYQGQCVMVVQYQGQCVMVVQYQGQYMMVVQYQGQCVMVVQYQGQCVMVVQHQGQCVMVVQYQGQCVMVVQYQGQYMMVVQYQGQCVMVVQYQGQCVMVVQYQGQCVMVVQYQGQCVMVVQYQGQWELFTRIAYSDKKTSVHSRIIWGCSWSHDDNYFATASRDKKVVVWGWRPDHSPAEGCLGECCACSTTLDVGEAATAVDFAPALTGSKGYCLAIGKESGTVVLYSWNPAGEKEDWTLLTTIDRSNLGHCLAVRRLAWRPTAENVEDEERNKYLQLASCGDDFTVRIFNISVDIVT
ncbi:Elongator subunit elp2 [Branchiostoma belcheri]|nr:Elongator subunit elp2 [Branchiostoma belcheri]